MRHVDCQSGAISRLLRDAIFLCFVGAATPIAAVADPPGGTLDGGGRPRILISTDIGGCDDNDFRSMVNLLVFADQFDIEGLVASPPCSALVKDILTVLDAYAADFPNLSTYAAYPHPDALAAVTVQGAIDPQSGSEPPVQISAGARHIIDAAGKQDARPLWVLAWGSMTDVAQALHTDPGIKQKIRVHSIGSWNTSKDTRARNYIYDKHKDLYWIENDQTFRGASTGGNQSGDLSEANFYDAHVKGHGALGDVNAGMKLNQSVTYWYLLRGDPENPAAPHWGGSFYRPDPAGRPRYWTDISKQSGGSADAANATVNVYRESFLGEYQRRMDRCSAPKSGGTGLCAEAHGRRAYQPSLLPSLTGSARTSPRVFLVNGQCCFRPHGQALTARHRPNLISIVNKQRRI